MNYNLNEVRLRISSVVVSSGLKGKNGDSAYQVAVDNGYVGTEQQWLASLKAQFGSFKTLAYNASGPQITPSADTTQNVYLMPNAASSPTAQQMWITAVNSDGATPSYEWEYLGDTEIDVELASGELIGDVHIVDDVSNGNQHDVLSAKQGMKMGQMLRGIGLNEAKISVISSGDGKNYNSGFYVDADNSVIKSTTSGTPKNGVLVVNVEGKDRLRFLGMQVATASSVGWGFSETSPTVADGTQLTNCGIWEVGEADGKKEYLIDIPSGMSYAVITVRVYNNVIMTLDEFYCYLVEGNTVLEEIEKQTAVVDDKVKSLNDELYSYSVVAPTTTHSGARIQSQTFNYTTAFDVNIYDLDEIDYDLFLDTPQRTLQYPNYYFVCWASQLQSDWPTSQSTSKDIAGLINVEYPLVAGKNDKVKLTKPNGAKYLYLMFVAGNTETHIMRESSNIDTINGNIGTINENIDTINSEVYEYSALTTDNIHNNAALVAANDGYFRYSGSFNIKIYDLDNIGGEIYLDTPNKVNDNSSYLYVAWSSAAQSEWPANAPAESQLIQINGFLSSAYPQTIGKYNRVALTKPEGAKYLYLCCYNTTASDTNILQTTSKIKRLEDSVQEKDISILCVGNSNSQDSFGYVPFLLKKVAPKIKLNIGILMLGSSSMVNHVHNFDNAEVNNEDYVYYESQYGDYQGTSSGDVKMHANGKSYTYQHCYAGDDSWTSGNLMSIQDGLEIEPNGRKWDIIVLNVSQNVFDYNENGTIVKKPVCSPYIALLVGKIAKKLDYNVKFAMLEAETRITKTVNGNKVGIIEGGTEDSPTDDTLHNRALWRLATDNVVYEESLFDIVFPVASAINNAITVDIIKQLGDYKDESINPNWIDTEDHSKGKYGYLRAPDGVHLQEGLPCQIAAYAVIIPLLKACGLDYRSVIGDDTICDKTWGTSHNTPGPHPANRTTAGYSIDERDWNKWVVRFAQKCAVMATKNPFSIIDMNSQETFYKVDASFNNCSIDNKVTFAAKGGEFIAKLTPNIGYTLNSSNTFIRKSDINNTTYSPQYEDITEEVLDFDTGIIFVPNVDFNIWIRADLS